MQTYIITLWSKAKQVKTHKTVQSNDFLFAGLLKRIELSSLKVLGFKKLDNRTLKSEEV